jgi:hypothetical protein
MYEEIAREIRNAAANRGKAAMVHYQVLLNAEHLRGVNAEEFCARVGIEPSWSVEFKKMLNLAQLLKDRGISLTGS